MNESLSFMQSQCWCLSSTESSLVILAMVLLFVSVLVLFGEMVIFVIMGMELHHCIIANVSQNCPFLWHSCNFHFYRFSSFAKCFTFTILSYSLQFCLVLYFRRRNSLRIVCNFASFILPTRPLIVKVLKQEVKPLCPSDQRPAKSQFERGKTLQAVNMTKAFVLSQSQYKTGE